MPRTARPSCRPAIRLLPRCSSAVGASMLVAALGLALGACSSQSSTGTTREVHAVPVAGTPGVGPVVAPTPTGGGPQEIPLGDRALAVVRTTATPAPDSTTSIEVAFVIRNLGSGELASSAGDFRLLVASGDAFSPLPGSDPAVAIAVAPGATRPGTLRFAVPDASTTRLQLLYRPATSGQSVLVPLAPEPESPTGVHQ